VETEAAAATARGARGAVSDDGGRWEGRGSTDSPQAKWLQCAWDKYASYAPADCMSRKGGSPVTRKQGREQEVALGELNPEAQMRKLQAVILEEEEEEEEEKKKEKEEEEEEEEPHHQGEVGAVCTTSCCDPTPNNWSTPSSPKNGGYPSAIESRAQNRVTVEPLFGAFIQNLRRRKQRWRPGGEIS